jgi:hypothetical protein
MRGCGLDNAKRSGPACESALSERVCVGTGGGTRTHTAFYSPRILSPVRLPFRHTGQSTFMRNSELPDRTMAVCATACADRRASDDRLNRSHQYPAAISAKSRGLESPKSRRGASLAAEFAAQASRTRSSRARKCFHRVRNVFPDFKRNPQAPPSGDRDGSANSKTDRQKPIEFASPKPGKFSTETSSARELSMMEFHSMRAMFLW